MLIGSFSKNPYNRVDLSGCTRSLRSNRSANNAQLVGEVKDACKTNNGQNKHTYTHV